MKTVNIKKVQERVANISIGPSTLRNQGPKGTVKAAREFLYKLDLEELHRIKKDDFKDWLNKRTKEMRDSFPGEAKGNWGAARKAMNVFLENAFYDRLLSDRYNLLNLEEWLEIPLDSNVVGNLRDDSTDKKISDLMKGFTIRGLKPKQSEKLQNYAKAVAEVKNTCRIYLDLYYWKAKEEKAGNKN